MRTIAQVGRRFSFAEYLEKQFESGSDCDYCDQPSEEFRSPPRSSIRDCPSSLKRTPSAQHIRIEDGRRVASVRTNAERRKQIVGCEIRA
jgi:hypothetical protein